VVSTVTQTCGCAAAGTISQASAAPSASIHRPKAREIEIKLPSLLRPRAR
jgi:hypothetical protein